MQTSQLQPYQTAQIQHQGLDTYHHGGYNDLTMLVMSVESLLAVDLDPTLQHNIMISTNLPNSVC